MAHSSEDPRERRRPGQEEVSGRDIVRIVAAILLPPLGVFLQVGLTAQFWINILLTLLGYVPGIVHAVWIIARR
ncbi:YqaE/Pmp3 family membrane protein [Marinicauda algicola]|uniref:YqaE/Pmp3 family membrane protein n=1 Tax=Marinicauda algicola TaxID=2029849 RepID=A0A4S2H0Q0_9PROT|nr:YqaE/Pmp3 family membrane protein [Marinicauda algicola]